MSAKIFKGWPFAAWDIAETGAFLGGLVLLAHGHYILGWLPIALFILILGHPKNPRHG